MTLCVKCSENSIIQLCSGLLLRTEQKNFPNTNTILSMDASEESKKESFFSVLEKEKRTTTEKTRDTLAS